jgi:chromosomal replication initiator protein
LERLRRQFSSDLAESITQAIGAPAPVRFVVETTPHQEAADEATRSPEGHCEAPAASHAGVPMNSTRPANSSRRCPARLATFVQGDGNRLAVTAALSVVQRPGTVSPLFLHGPNGCGKTHLLEGIWHELRNRCRMGRAVLLSAEQFTSYFLGALQGSGLPSFRRKVREVDLLAVDDVQFFAGKRATLVELQHTIDALLRNGRQLVLVADRPPAGLKGLGPETIGRLTGGLVCGVEAADFDTRLGIARHMAEQGKLSVPEPVLRLLASELEGDARQISGALNRLEASSEMLQQPISLELAQRALADIFRATRRVVHLGDIERAVCDVFGLEPKSLRAGRKSKSITQPRMLAMWLARKYTRAAFSEISHHFGRRSHSTVISAEKQVNRWVADGAQVLCGPGQCPVEDAIRRVETQLRVS